MRTVVATAAAAVVTFMAMANPGSFAEGKRFVDVEGGARVSGVDIEAHRALATTSDELSCLNGYPGIQTDDVCCALECGGCGGAGCSTRPGGDASCCTSTIKAEGSSCSEVDAAPCYMADLCDNGYSGIQSGDVCCALECGSCGGTACGSRPGGQDSCCTSIIKESGSSCSEVDAAPCFFEGDTTPAPTVESTMGSPTPMPAMVPSTPTPVITSTCSNGYPGIEKDSVCCDIECGTCGGTGCGGLPGGEASCCTSKILAEGYSCDDVDEAPCFIPGDTTPAPTVESTMGSPTPMPAMVPSTPTPVITSTCSNGYPGIEKNSVCCDIECGTCGGTGCGSLPGGAASCCTSRILSEGYSCDDVDEAPCFIPEPTPSPTMAPIMPPTLFPTMSTCSNGFYGYQSGNVCCDVQCGACGGFGCRALPGGPDHCCTSRILDAGISCDDTDEAPCIIPGPTPSPTMAPIMPPTPSPTMSTCSNGFYGYQSGDVCCDVQCGACGGFGCRALPGGPDHCCTSRILDAGISCDDVSEAPCIIVG